MFNGMVPVSLQRRGGSGRDRMSLYHRGQCRVQSLPEASQPSPGSPVCCPLSVGLASAVSAIVTSRAQLIGVLDGGGEELLIGHLVVCGVDEAADGGEHGEAASGDHGDVRTEQGDEW
jgi:hypothetical protein